MVIKKCEICGKRISYHYGKRPDKFCRKHLSRVGKNNPNWKGTGGPSSFWAKKIKERDNHTCQKCGLYDPLIVQADHIKSRKLYPELALNIENGITLCPNCHVRKTLLDKELYKVRIERLRAAKRKSI